MEGKDKDYSPEEVSSVILGQLRELADAKLGQTTKDCVITVPTYFNDQQRAATREAGKLANFNVLKIANEAVAAATAYELDKNGQNTLIFYYGGSTIDVTILSKKGGKFETKANKFD